MNSLVTNTKKYLACSNSKILPHSLNYVIKHKIYFIRLVAKNIYHPTTNLFDIGGRMGYHIYTL